MDALPDLAEQRTDEMRQEIDSTRSAMTDKMEALEDQVMGTVKSAQETVENSIQIARDAVATVKSAFDIEHHVQQHPWLMVGGCFLAGLALGRLFQGVGRRPRQAPDWPAAGPAMPAEQRGNGFASNVAPPQHQSPPPSRPGLFDLFHDEIGKVQGMAIGYVMGLARDAMHDAAPQWAPQIDGVMNSVTTKLGGEPVPQRST